MKKKILVHDQYGLEVEKEIQYIPFRFIIAIFLAVLETACVIAITYLCAIYIPYFYIAIFLTEFFCVLQIINSPENPDYKIPWLLFVLVVPVAGFMIYFMFYNRRLSKKQIKRNEKIKEEQLPMISENKLLELEKVDKQAYLQANLLCKIAETNLYQNTDIQYFEFGEKAFPSMLEDLKKAEKFIFLEYFIIQEGIFWDSILDMLKEKAKNGVEVRVIYDDIGCMCTLSGDYYKTLQKYEIFAVFKTVVYSKNTFKYYDFVNFNNKDEFSEFINKCKELSLYETNIKPKYQDKFITLSTCEYSNKNGRLVVIARKIDN